MLAEVNATPSSSRRFFCSSGPPKAYPGANRPSEIHVAGQAVIGGQCEIDGAFNHDGTTFGALGTTPATQASASADLTGSASGTANGSIQALTDPADTPISADALRDDLVANLIPELRNNIDELRVKVNDALTALRRFGFIAP